jgi:hypothetical protein
MVEGATWEGNSEQKQITAMLHLQGGGAQLAVASKA